MFPSASNLALGTWVFFVPWLLGFAGATSIAAWNAWTVGGAIAGLAVWSLERIRTWHTATRERRPGPVHMCPFRRPRPDREVPRRTGTRRMDLESGPPSGRSSRFLRPRFVEHFPDP